MSVSMFEWVLSISLTQLAGYLMHPLGRKEFERLIKHHLDQGPQATPPAQRTPRRLQDYVDVYGEQVTDDAVADVHKYFPYYYIPGLTVGGLPTGMSPLGVAARHVRCSDTALAVLGEGLAGWFFEQRGWMPLARPIRWPTDLVFTRIHQNRMDCALVQVKCTQWTTVRQNIKGEMAAAAVEHAAHAFWVQQYEPNTAYSCHVVGVIVNGSDDFDVLSLLVCW